MKPRLSPALHQQLILTPQLRLAIRLLQLSTAELELEVAEAMDSNPLLDWAEDNIAGPANAHETRDADGADGQQEAQQHEQEFVEERWDREGEPWQNASVHLPMVAVAASMLRVNTPPARRPCTTTCSGSST